MSSVYIYNYLYTVAQIKEIIFCHISSSLHIATHDNLEHIKMWLFCRSRTEYKLAGLLIFNWKQMFYYI